MTEKKFIITEEQREEIIGLINRHSTMAAKNLLNQLEEFKMAEDDKKDKKEKSEEKSEDKEE